MQKLFFITWAILLLVGMSSSTVKPKKILVFSKTTGFRHSSIEPGIKALKKLALENRFDLISTERSEYFTPDSLQKFDLVVFLNTTGDILNDNEQAAFEQYIQAGGGFVGVHSATDTEYDWPWYNKLVGAYFLSHPKVQEATLHVLDNSHPATKMLDKKWIKTDEWYNFKDMNPDIHVLISIDESSYSGGKNGEHHPIAWYHEYDGGRAFYTAMGHTDESYKEPRFLAHLLGGIRYAMRK